MGAFSLAFVCDCRLVHTFMGTSIGTKIDATNVGGFCVGDNVSHSKIGTSIGRILYFAKFSDGMYAVIDYGRRRRVDRLVDLLPALQDIYVEKEVPTSESSYKKKT